MKKLYLLLLLHIWAGAGFAQNAPAALPTRWQQHADSIFQHLDHSLVSTGLLTNYGFALKDYNQFRGTALTAANRLQHLGEWRLLYAALQTSVFNANATLPTLLVANQRIMQARQQNTAVVSIATLLARYDRFRDDAGTAGLVTVSNRQLYDNASRSRSPYEQRTLVALCPLQTTLDTRTPQFSFPSQLRFTNAAPTISTLELDAGDGQGYRAVAWDQTIGATYAANGTYTLRFRLTCADGTVLLSQARLNVQQPDAVAARYGNNGVVTQHSSTLFTDTRAYNGAVASGRVTVAYADGNTTGTIRKPLIVFEGYDVSHALNNSRYNFSYNTFITQPDLGAINSQYNASNPTDKLVFKDQLSDVGQYDLIFLDYDNGTDYIQRNAYLAERLIQWVNDNKQPLNGVRQQNVVLGMSMGGLVARYALRDMEVRRAANPSLPAHDTRLYISHEAPHQGANVPLGFQYMVKSVAAIQLVPGFTLGQLNPEVGDFAGLLDEPATQQLLIYQTDPRGGAVHTAWLNEYNQLGYPQQCRNVATSGGSECGRPQSFAPGARLLTIQGNGLLDDDYNDYANAGIFGFGTVLGASLLPFLGPAGFLVPFTVGLIFSLGNFEGHVDFTVNALPSQQQRSIFHGRFSICKDVLFGAFSTCLLDYSDDNNSDAYMLAYDSAPGGIYDINQVSGNALSQIGTSIPVAGVAVSVQPTFCFVPTTSALDIGGGDVALAPQDLTASYTNAAPPAAPRNTPFANFITGVRENLPHILWNGLNSKWAFQEMQQGPQNISCLSFCQASLTILGNTSICAGGTTYTIDGLPPGTSVGWSLATTGSVTNTYSYNSPTFTTAFTDAFSGPGTLTATISSECGLVRMSKQVYIGVPAELDIAVEEQNDCVHEVWLRIVNYDPLLRYTVRGAGVSAIRPDGLFRVKVPSYTISVTNTCGTISTTGYVEFNPCSSALQYSVYPNPANNAVTVEQTDSTTALRGQAAREASAVASSPSPGTPYTVRLYDGYGVQLIQQATTTPTLQLNTGTLPTGLYLLHIEAAGVIIERRRVQITH
jgi:hypothetical protein